MKDQILELDVDQFINRYTKAQKIERLYKLADRLGVQIGGDDVEETENINSDAVHSPDRSIAQRKGRY